MVALEECVEERTPVDNVAIANSILSKNIVSSRSLKWFDVFNTSA